MKYHTITIETADDVTEEQLLQALCAILYECTLSFHELYSKDEQRKVRHVQRSIMDIMSDELTTIQELLNEFIEQDLLNDRREYTIDDFQTSYPLSLNGAESLYRIVQYLTDPDLKNPYDIDPKVIQEFLIEGEHNNWDGWSDGQKVILWDLMYDLALFNQSKERSKQ